MDNEPIKVLIIDDVPMNTELLTSILKKKSYEPIVADRGITGIEKAKEHQPELILLDIMMPEMDGFEVCEQLKADDDLRDIPVIFMSALHDTGEKLRAFQAGGIDYVTKPYSIKEVLARVETQVLLRHQQKELKQRYHKIQQLQRVIRKFHSDRAWKTITSDLESIADDRFAPHRERMTIMFTDIAGFTSFSENDDPDALLADLSTYMNMLSRVVYDMNGQVDKFMGDGMLAFFDDAASALQAARNIQNEVQGFNQLQTGAGRPLFRTRIGLATGDILVAHLGFQDRREFALIGDRVNTAARLQHAGPEDGIIMDEATYTLCEEPDYSHTDRIPLKGKMGDERVYIIEADLIS